MNVSVVLFDDFETLDAFGPVEVFGKAPEYFHITYLSINGGIVNSSQGVKVWTEPLEEQENVDILIIPGGKGAKKLLSLEQNSTDKIKKMALRSNLCLMVANGSAVLAQSGLLFRRKVANYSFDTNWKRMFTAGVVYVPDIRWAADGKYYSCANSITGIDMALGVVADMVDIDLATNIAEKLGYQWQFEDNEGILQ